MCVSVCVCLCGVCLCLCVVCVSVFVSLGVSMSGCVSMSSLSSGINLDLVSATKGCDNGDNLFKADNVPLHYYTIITFNNG